MKHLGMTLAAAFFFAGATAFAEVIFSPAVTYNTGETQIDGTTVSESTGYQLDARLGYLMPTGLYLGGIYSMTSGDLDDDSTGSYFVGPSVGYANSGFSIIGSYFLTGEYEPAANIKLTEGKGIQIDVSYALPVSQSFHLGPQLSYRSVTFDTRETGGVDQDVETKITSMYPMINLWFVF